MFCVCCCQWQLSVPMLTESIYYMLYMLGAACGTGSRNKQHDARMCAPSQGNEVVAPRVAGEGHEGAASQLLTHPQLPHELSTCG
jgi:hypothetical protein